MVVDLSNINQKETVNNHVHIIGEWKSDDRVLTIFCSDGNFKIDQSHIDDLLKADFGAYHTNIVDTTSYTVKNIVAMVSPNVVLKETYKLPIPE
jgi:hypothetical protein